MLLIDNVEVVNDYEPIPNPDGEDIVPITDDILDGFEDESDYNNDYLDGVEHEPNEFARGMTHGREVSLIMYGFIGVALLIVLAAVFMRVRDKI